MKTIAFVVVLIAWTIAGIWATGMLTPNVYVHGAAVAVFALVTVGVLLVATRGARGSLRRSAVGAVVATLLIVVAVGAFLSRPTTVNEKIATARDTGVNEERARSDLGDGGSGGAERPPAARANRLLATGSFESLAHDTKGTARVIDLAGRGSVLTLSDFSTDPGPDLFVYAVAGNPEGDDEVSDYVNLGALKGTRGNQQYELPEDFDVDSYRHIYIWCRAFTVGFGRAELEA